MALIHFKHLRGNTSQVAAYTGVAGEIVVDSTTNQLVLQDGNTAGGFYVAKDQLATIVTRGLMAPEDKLKLNSVADNANNYIHPTTSGNKHIPSGGSSGQILRWSADGTAVWGSDNNTTYSVFGAATSSAAGSNGLVPAPAAGDQAKFLRADKTWAAPANTTYSAGSGLSLSGTTFAVTSTAGTSTLTWNTEVTLCTIAGVAIKAKLPANPNTNTTYSAGTGLSLSGTTFNLVTAGSALGGVKTTSTVTSTTGLTACPIIDGVVYYKDTNTTYTLSSLGIGNVKNYDQSKAISSITRSGTTFTYTCLDGTTGTFTQQDNNTTYVVFKASGTNHATGLVPDPGATAGTAKYLREDATWATPPNTTYSAATQSAAGLMSAADKTKLDGIATSANAYSLPTAGSSLGGVKTTSTVTSTSGLTACPIISGVVYYKDTNTTYSNMGAATSSAAGTAGLVPAPAAGKQASFLRGDGTWVVPTNTTYSAMTGASAAADGATGLVPKPTKGNQAKFLRADGTWQTPTNTTYTNMGASGTNHKAGLVPDPGATAGTTKYLREDGTWQVPPDTNTTYTLSSLGIGNVKNYDQSKAIKSITRSGTTFTYTCLDGTTGTFTQQDNNTDTKVNVILGTTTKSYLLGTSTTPTATATGVTTIADTGVYLGTTAGELVATKFTGALNGNANTATKQQSSATDGNYSDVVNVTDGTSNNYRIGTIRVNNNSGSNTILLGVHNESNGAPSGLEIKNTNGTLTANFPGTFTSSDFSGALTGSVNTNQVKFKNTSEGYQRSDIRILDDDTSRYGLKILAFNKLASSASVADIRFGIVKDTTNSFLELRVKNVMLSGDSFKPMTHNVTALGSDASKFTQLYATNGTIQTSDRNKKTNIIDVPDALLDAWENVVIKQYQMKDSYVEKGENARLHIGIIAQDSGDALRSKGLNPEKYGFFCYNKWDDQYTYETTYDADGNSHSEKVVSIPAGEEYGVRPEEALFIECAYLRKQIELLKAKIK